jgi:ParB family chromosome partitioning protein
MSDLKRKVLGRGLSSLLDSSYEEKNQVSESTSLHLSLDTIVPGHHQPRHHFPEDELNALAASIREKGILQPILVRSHAHEEGKYEIVAGERRWRAAKIAELTEIPALIREFSDVEALEVGLLENIQRQDLNPIEEAEGYRRLAEEFHHTQESLARILGKSRSHIANILRLLTLPKKVKDYLMEGKLSAGHGRALVGVEDPEYLADLILEKNLNVRQAELLSKQDLAKEKGVGSASHPDPEKEILRNHLAELLGQPVDLILKGMGGKVVIPFKNPTDLDLLIQKFNQLS